MRIAELLLHPRPDQRIGYEHARDLRRGAECPEVLAAFDPVERDFSSREILEVGIEYVAS
ncbi:MAG TPA: hypothetical protein VN605_01135 [Thermoanaerobaculia bacterium]|nr:hypothetical protein [Thermoanaerobaculia bacterium]